MNKFTTSPVSKHSESGNSLISLMIGIALSTITMLTATHMHTSHQLAVNDLNDSITHDRTILTSLSIIEKEIQNAGYGIPNADQNHIMIEFDAGDSTTPAIRSLLWRFITDEDSTGITNGVHETPHCRKLTESGGTIDGKNYRFLKLFASSSCHPSNPLQNTTWDIEIGRLGQWEIKDAVVTRINTEQTFFTFALNSTTCSFPGLDNPDVHLEVQIQAPNSAELNGHDDLPENGINVCLTNIHP